MAKTIGIDLGTTNSVVSVLEGGQPTVIHNSEGRNTTPSVVAVTKDGEWVVGEIAKNQIITNPNTVASIKRYMGRDHSVKLNGKKYSPQEISAKILMKLKADAEAYLGERITEAVITVPAYFEDAQRQATKDAGKIAGLEVKRIINEPTAAALAYGFDKKDKEQTIMVYDLGGGTFDVSILQIGDGVFEVKATAGNNFLGGDDFDEALMHYIAKEFKKEQGIDLMGDPQAKQRLRVSAEKAKIELSAKNTTQINLPFITADASGPKHLDIEISRSKFEELIFDIVQKTVEPTKQAMSDANVRQEDIDQVILVGGSTRVPMVADIVQQITGKAPNKSVNPDEVVAIGAAIQAGVLAGELKGESGGIVLLDVTPLSLGVETLGGVFTKMINRNTTIPTQKKEVYSTAADGQTSVEIHVLQGEREMAAYNKTLGKFHLTDIPPAPRGIPQIEVSFDIDANGILQVNAKDLATQRQQTITITASTNLSKNDVERMVREAEAHAEEDKKRREEAEIHNNAETLIYRTEKNLKDFGDKIPDAEKKDVEEKLEATKQAVQSQDLNRIKSTTDDLLQATFKMSEHMYKDVGQTQQQAHEQAYAGVDPIETPHSNEPSPNDQVANGKVVDADFDEVK